MPSTKNRNLSWRSSGSLRKRITRRGETSDQRHNRLQSEANRMANMRSIANSEVRNRPYSVRQWCRCAFKYDSGHEYESEKIVLIGPMSKLCFHCCANKFEGEQSGICCSNGKIKLSIHQDPPLVLKDLLEGTTSQSKHFLQYIRKYNSAFQMTSFGANVIIESGFMPTFKVQGQVYHRFGSLQPLPGNEPKYLQIYFISDNQQQAQNRCGSHQGTRLDIILKLQEMLHVTNSYIQSFKYALEHLSVKEYTIIIDADKRPSGEHVRRFNAPECNEVAIIISGEQHGKRDIVLKYKNKNNNDIGSIKRISETHRSYDALQYPLLFPNGEDGYHFGIPQADSSSRKTVSCMDFYRFYFMTRNNNFNHLHRCQQLFNQFAVDMYAKIESERLCYIVTHQKELRVDSYIHLRDGIQNDATGRSLGQICILPSSFTGSPRYMHERTQDAMTYVRNYGRPDLFITFTCNAKWTEIQNELLPGQTYFHRHDLIARVFRLKLVRLMDLITKFHIFGPVRCHMYTIEWQKRGLPHAHILVWLTNKIHSDEIDSLISAELPDPSKDKTLFEIIKTQMVHGPCGSFNYNSPCMKDNRCSKRFPKKFISETQIGADGYPSYRRRKPEDGGFQTKIGQHEIDNRWIVPYCPLLSKTFNAHINVEFCNSVKSIKYVCKYVNKGSDAAMYALQDTTVHNEVTQYQMGRYISSNEAFWRIFGFAIHDRYPTVQHLAVHLENGQRVYFTTDTAARQAQSPRDTTLTAFFKLCQRDSFARTLLYNQLPSYYTWNNNQWSRRKRGKAVEGHPGIKYDTAIGRVYTVHPSQHECFFLRLLLHEVTGPTTFASLRTINDYVCETYREACFKRGLLEDDRQWEATLLEAIPLQTAKKLRCLLAILLRTCEISNPLALWMKFIDDLAEDFRYQAQIQNSEMEICFSDEIYNLALLDIEDKIISLGGENLHSFGLPNTKRNEFNILCTEILRETSYDINTLTKYIQEYEPKLLPDQHHVYSVVLNQVAKQMGGIYFLDAPGGTGKTFVTKLLLAKLRQQKEIVLAVASSGIAATLLPGGRTAHSVFKLPLNLNANDLPVCNISKTSGMAEIIKRCKLIVWDECTMAHKKALEAINRTLQDILNCKSLMGGITVLLSGDFRQTLPVITKGTKAALESC